MIKVLMVCLGNICRSPMAEAVFRRQVAEAGLADQIEVASAGTGDWHLGEAPHAGTRTVLAQHGIGVTGMRAQHVTEFALADIDYVVAMDADNLRDLEGKGRLLLEYAEPRPRDLDVPDPYYDGSFSHVYALVEHGTRGLLGAIVTAHGLEAGTGTASE